ncbi:MAG: hypothetical protein DDT29_02361 [Dehalococcoidia bacterium]|nr:hypothetical protein [Bacillota bacterium]
MKHWKLILVGVWMLYVFIDGYSRTSKKLKREGLGRSQKGGSVKKQPPLVVVV